MRDRGLHHAAGDLEPRREQGPVGRGDKAQHPLLDQGRLRHHSHGRAGTGHIHHAGAAAQGQTRQCRDKGARAAVEAHHRSCHTRDQQGKSRHPKIRRLHYKVGDRALMRVGFREMPRIIQQKSKMR